MTWFRSKGGRLTLSRLVTKPRMSRAVSVFSKNCLRGKMLIPMDIILVVITGIFHKAI